MSLLIRTLILLDQDPTLVTSFNLNYFHKVEKEMASHSSILAWKIPRMEEHGRLQSTGSQSDITEQLTHTK